MLGNEVTYESMTMRVQTLAWRTMLKAEDQHSFFPDKYFKSDSSFGFPTIQAYLSSLYYLYRRL